MSYDWKKCAVCHAPITKRKRGVKYAGKLVHSWGCLQVARATLADYVVAEL